MRHRPYRAVARAAALVAVLACPFTIVTAQTNKQEASAGAVMAVSGTVICSKGWGFVGGRAAVVRCGRTDIDPGSQLPYSALATGVTTPGIGGGVHAYTRFSGSSPGVELTSQGLYTQYVTIHALPSFDVSQIATIFLASEVTISGSSSDPSLKKGDYDNEFGVGALDAFGIPRGGGSGVDRYTPGGDPLPKNFSLQASMDGNQLGPWHTFYFDMWAFNTSVVFPTDHDVFTDNLMRSPSITFTNADGRDITPDFTVTYDPPVATTTTPEPASTVLTMTGLVSLAGIARPRRRSAAGLWFQSVKGQSRFLAMDPPDLPSNAQLREMPLRELSQLFRGAERIPK